MQKKFTDKLIKNLKPKTYIYDLREPNSNGFAARVFPSGEISWTFIYTFQGRKRRMTLGKYSQQCSLAKARELHRDALKILASKKDPALEKQQEKDEARRCSTIKGLIEEYIEKWAKPRKRSSAEDERILNKDVKPSWGNLKAKDITRRDIILLLDKIKGRGSPIQANRTLACVRRMFNFAVEQDILQHTPCTAIKAPSKENRRDRVLTTTEIKNLWSALDKNMEENKSTIHMSPLARLALKLQLITAQRKGEIIDAEWSEIDLVSGWWTIPAKKAKNGNAHRVFLSEFALDTLHQIKQLSENSPFLFPAKPKKYSLAMVSDNNKRRPEKIYMQDTADGLQCDYMDSIKNQKQIIIPWIKLPATNAKDIFRLQKQSLPIILKTAKLSPYRLEKTHITGEAIDHALRRCTFDGIEPFVPHDLRRSGASHMTSIGISRLVVSKILNHVESSVTAIYDRHSYDAEKQNALETWSKRLKEIITGEQESNVIQLKKAI